MAGPIATAAEEQKRKVLEVGAQAGDAGVRAYEEASRRVAEYEQDALRRSQLAGQQISAPASATGAELITRPSAHLQQILESEKAAHKGFAYDTTSSSMQYLDRLGAIEPLVDKLIAAKLAEEAAARGGGGSGGGGSGGGGGGGGETYSDSELRVRLKGDAAVRRDQMVAEAAGTLEDKRAARGMTGKIRKKLRKQLRKQAKGGRLGGQVTRRRVLSNPGVRGVSGTGVNRRIARLEKVKKPTKRQKVQLRELRETRDLLRSREDLARLARRQQRELVGAYGDLRATYTQSLGPIARQIGVEEWGLAPEEAFGLIGPSEERTLDNADIENLRNAGGPLAVFGAPPRLKAVPAASDLGISPKRAKIERASPQYRQLAADIQLALQKGTPITEMAAALDEWREPREVQVKKKDGTTATKVIRGRPELVDLLLYDFAPAFSR